MKAGMKERGFFAAHWEFVVLGVCLLALVGAGVFAVSAFGVDPEAKADDLERELKSMKRADTGVTPVEIAVYTAAADAIGSPKRLPEPSAERGGYLVSPGRSFCANPDCQKPIDGEAVTCPLCGVEQPKDQPKVADTDHDGLPDDWETQFGLDPNDASDADADTDRDGFTNAEEFAAATNPSDAMSHPDYLDYVTLRLPLRETVLPFYFKGTTETPNGRRYQFFDPKRRNDYGKPGTTYQVMEGEEIGDTGFIVKGYEEKAKKVRIKGSEQEKSVDVSEATIERKADGKRVALVLEEKRKPIDIQAVLFFERGNGDEIVVIPGDTIDLRGLKYEVKEIRRLSNGARIVLEHPSMGEPKTIEALEP